MPYPSGSLRFPGSPLDHGHNSKPRLLFSTRTGRQLYQSNILRRSLHPILANLKQPKTGCRAFRLSAFLVRENLVPEDLITFWHGHAGKTVTDSYSKLKDATRSFESKWPRKWAWASNSHLKKRLLD